MQLNNTFLDRVFEREPLYEDVFLLSEAVDPARALRFDGGIELRLKDVNASSGRERYSTCSRPHRDHEHVRRRVDVVRLERGLKLSDYVVPAINLRPAGELKHSKFVGQPLEVPDHPAVGIAVKTTAFARSCWRSIVTLAYERAQTTRLPLRRCSAVFRVLPSTSDACMKPFAAL